MRLCTIFQNARSIVNALEQRVIYTHFLPLVMGPRFLNQFGLKLLSNVSMSSLPKIDSNESSFLSSKTFFNLLNMALDGATTSWVSKKSFERLLFSGSIPYFVFC